MNSDYVGFPRNRKEEQLSALPIVLLLDYANTVLSNPESLERLKTGWDRNIRSHWTDDQFAELAWLEEKQGEQYLSSKGYGGLYKRHMVALAMVEKAIFEYLNNPSAEFETFLRERLVGSPYVLETYSTD
ncbi:hypothetical protein [Roseibium sediminicola]|uniref:Uncharacterized protein n=1 Tax=Roseibium sediminicola TaxID=2933272 RepID=A0ABT0GY89_9HYPH|nr:hypothetical protein [Roseibium sp. CAU 1639]MCK7614399.1 hypothetical protein [Roseibium sp. CAU 1639]